MKKVHTFRVLPCLAIALSAALLSGCFGPTPSIRYTVPNGWRFLRVVNDGNGALLIPKNETNDSWTELIHQNVIYRSFFGASSPSEWLDGSREFLRKNHPENSVTMIREAPEGILFEGVERASGDPDKEYVGRLLDRNASRFLLKYFVRAPKRMTPSRRKKWIDWLLEARITPPLSGK